ncbi:hypothetical protein Pla52o_11010 [Novipirellula galeiformis]|uniref:Uncharacterized protein n=1 Tax=Novipirellula galeiformis TaxID=2528004 RepID=A0A5C6CN73_9BACT|nr:hypothetical protein Pla52o_11010 [Novipirellula galeiformis]
MAEWADGPLPATGRSDAHPNVDGAILPSTGLATERYGDAVVKATQTLFSLRVPGFDLTQLLGLQCFVAIGKIELG